MLYGMRQFNRAACFIEAAMEFNLLEKNQDNGVYKINNFFFKDYK